MPESASHRRKKRKKRKEREKAAKKSVKKDKKKKRKTEDAEIEAAKESEHAPVATVQVTEGEDQQPVEVEEKTVPEKGIKYTVSVALPGSICSNAQSMELRTYLAGQIARAVTVYNIDEVIIFDENAKAIQQDAEFKGASRKYDPNVFLARILQYLETPQYLRKALFPVHKDLKYAGLLNPVDAPHHVRATEESQFREGVVMKRPVKAGAGGSWVDVGLKKDAYITNNVQPGVRVTVEMDHPDDACTRRVVTGKAVAPTKPRETSGVYWGYQTRLAEGLKNVFEECPYEGGYDCTIGTSERGVRVYDAKEAGGFSLPQFKHVLIVFGGLGGLEDCVMGDQNLTATDPSSLFDIYVNTCPYQGSRTIRTEEAMLITLAALHPFLVKNNTPS